MNNAENLRKPGEPGILEKIRLKARMKHMAEDTGKAYANWAKRFIIFHGIKHPLKLGKKDVEAFLSHLASERNVAASTQNQALAALLFMYKEVLEKDLPWLDGVVRAKKPKRLFVADTQGSAIREVSLDGVEFFRADSIAWTAKKASEFRNLNVR